MIHLSSKLPYISRNLSLRKRVNSISKSNRPRFSTQNSPAPSSLTFESSNIHRDKCFAINVRQRNVVSRRITRVTYIYTYIYIYIGDMGVSRIRGREKIYICPSAGNKSSDRVLNFDSTDQVGSGGERMRWREWWMIVSDKLTESKIDVHTFVPSPPVHVQFYSVKLTT